MLVWLNGRVVPAARARVSALDRGLLHGDGAYDTWRTYDTRPFAVAAHIRRLTAATRALGLPVPGSAATWEARSRLLAKRNGLGDAAIRLTITRGDAGDVLVPTRSARPTQLLTVRALPPDLAERQARGVAVVLLPFPRDVGAPWGRLKLIGHASAVAGRALAARRHAAEGLYVTPTGEVTEATTANVFLVERGGIVTPPLASGILPGVTRAIVLRLARRAGLDAHEEPITIARLKAAAEVFLTASTVEVLPVIRIDTHRQASGKPGPITRLLQTAYAAYVRTTLRRS